MSALHVTEYQRACASLLMRSIRLRLIQSPTSQNDVNIFPVGISIAFTATQQAAGGTQAPHIVLALPQPAVIVPTGVAFDADGNLWVTSEDGRLAEFAPASLAASGEPQAVASLVLHGYGLLWSAAIWPIPAGLPIR